MYAHNTDVIGLTTGAVYFTGSVRAVQLLGENSSAPGFQKTPFVYSVLSDGNKLESPLQARDYTFVPNENIYETFTGEAFPAGSDFSDSTCSGPLYSVCAKYMNITDNYIPIALGLMASDQTISYFKGLYQYAIRIVYQEDGSFFIESQAG